MYSRRSASTLVTLSLENGKKFVIESNGNSREDVYVDKVKLFGKELEKNFITHDQIMKGGQLLFKMTSEPDRSRGTKEEAVPYSMSGGE